MEDKKRFFELLSKKKLNNATLGDIAEFNILSKKLEIDLSEFKSLDDLMNIKFSSKFSPQQNKIEKSWEKLYEKIQQPDPLPIQIVSLKPNRNRRLMIIISSIAASLIITLSIGFLFFKNVIHNADKLNIISTQNGSKSKVQMPDGTEVWLNGGSKITYNDQYGINTRTVTLIGEAYFDVKHDSKHPFIILTKNLTLKVLGTAFNVKAYDTESESEATLIRGSLEVSFPTRPNEKIVLKPKEKVSFVDNNFNIKPSEVVKTEQQKPMISLTKVDYLPKEKLIEEIAWTDNRLIFRSKEFKELALDLERWYNVKIEIQNNKIKDKKFTGIFKNETVLEALDALRQTYSFSYVLNKTTNTIIIK